MQGPKRRRVRPDKTRRLRLEPTRAFAMTHTFAYNAALESLAEQHVDELEADAGAFDEDNLFELMQEA